MMTHARPSSAFQSTRPVWSETDLAYGKWQFFQNFNPLAPCGARPVDEGRGSPTRRFQSTRPVWSETSTPRRAGSGGTFQSTRPVWSETRKLDVAGSCRRKFQSTRPVWSETLALRTLREPYRYFNPLAPCGARHDSRTTGHATTNFNPLAPCGARPGLVRIQLPLPNISIHSPRVERDVMPPAMLYSFSHFNPLAPCGARRKRLRLLPQEINFNPLAPCGARQKHSFGSVLS